jgi:hypothetical protein
MYGYISQARVAMILSAIEESLYNSKVDVLQVPKALSIEPIMPQSWREHWPLSGQSGLLEEEAEAARDAHLHLLGNLTLTALPMNSGLSNAAWQVKQKELNMSSKLLLNAQLIGNYPLSFVETSIDQRSAELCQRVLTIWPGSDAW